MLSYKQPGQRVELPFVGIFRKENVTFQNRVVYYNKIKNYYLYYAGVSRSWVVSILIKIVSCPRHVKLEN